MVMAYHVVLVLVVGMVLVATYSAIHVVEEGDVEALLVFGTMKRVLHPGITVVPPLISRTYPIDPTTMSIEKSHETVAVPEEFQEAVHDEDAAGTDRDTEPRMLPPGF